MGRPLWLQEQNSVPGSTNRFLSRFAERAYVAFAQGAEFLSRAKRVEVLPNPVRAEIFGHGEPAAMPKTTRASDWIRPTNSPSSFSEEAVEPPASTTR